MTELDENKNEFSDEFKFMDSSEIDEEIKEENNQTYEDLDSKELAELEARIDKLSNQNNESRFPRTETKTDFASGIINSDETKKICNLTNDTISDLVEKRKFFNFLEYFGWDGLANRVIKNVRDVEDYSLSEKGKLIDSVFIERSRNEAKSIQEERRGKK